MRRGFLNSCLFLQIIRVLKSCFLTWPKPIAGAAGEGTASIQIVESLAAIK